MNKKYIYFVLAFVLSTSISSIAEEAPKSTDEAKATPKTTEVEGVAKDDDKKDPLMFGKYKTFKRKLKENSDNNNIMLKQVLDGIDKVEVKIDEMNDIKTELVIEDEPEYKTFKDKYKL